ncbi:hypothetical protein IFM89_029962, partial [Coptis chinensis]
VNRYLNRRHSIKIVLCSINNANLAEIRVKEADGLLTSTSSDKEVDCQELKKLGGDMKDYVQSDDTAKVGKGSAIWNIFQSQDVIHPIHDQTFFLDEKHNKQLENEFDVEPWTFEQYLGDAIFIPAGCPQQVRNIVTKFVDFFKKS